MMTPRILVVSTYYYPVIGGVEIHARQLVTYLRGRGYRVEVITKRVGTPKPAEDTVDGVPVHRIGPGGERRGSGKWAFLPALTAALVRRRSAYDVIVCVDYRGIGVAAIPVGALLGKAVVAQGEVAGVLAGADLESTSGLARESILTTMLKAPVRSIYKHADAIVCIGRDLEREALRAGIPRDRVHYVPHGVDLERFRPAAGDERERLRARLGWPASRPVVLFVGRLSLEKGVADLMDAWRLADRADALLALVGPDMTGHPWDAGGPARAFVAAHGLEGSVRFDGATADPAPFYRAADVFVQPSHFEALGNTAIEAMASGLPVVTSGVGGLADFCEDDVTALVHEPRSPESLAAAIERMLHDPALRARLAAAGRTIVMQRFELNTLMARYASLIESVVRR